MSMTFKQFLEAKQLLLFEPEPTEVSPAKITKKLKENHSWSEFNYRFGEDPKKTKRKAKKLRKKFGIQLDMPGDYK